MLDAKVVYNGAVIDEANEGVAEMETIDCEPNPNLFESMRSFGYSLETAVADIIDNSIAANADTIRVLFNGDGDDRYIAIVDNGSGMDEDTARKAMQLAGTGTSLTRSESDLGRFGLGLKTASFSQARQLTVYTKQPGNTTTLQWDLDDVAQAQRWALASLNASETTQMLPAPVRSFMEGTDHGTCVLWRKLDRIEASIGSGPHDLDAAMRVLLDYLGLVFHRFLNPYPDDTFERITIDINGMDVTRHDPFLQGNPAVQHASGAQPLTNLADGKPDAILRGYTMPFYNKLTDKDRRLLWLTGERGHTLFDTQGFYIYRAGRLITWANWFGLMAKKEDTKYARVRIDVSNRLDSEWSLDVKKSVAIPPKAVRQMMKTYIQTLAKPSRRIVSFRGRRDNANPMAPVWNVIKDRESYRYEINEENPWVSSFVDTLDSQQCSDFSKLLSVIASCIPFNDINSHYASDEKFDETIDETMLVVKAYTLWSSYKTTHGNDPEGFVKEYSRIEPFCLSNNCKTILKEATNVQ